MNEINSDFHALTFDVEDWYQGFIYRGIGGWEKYGSREKKNVQKILDILDTHNTKATFFVLGSFAEANPDIVKLIHENGHEIASHGHSHIHVPKLTPKDFREDIRRSKNFLEDITNEKIIGYRAASWSINKDSYWGLEILAEENFIYDSSIFPSSFHPFGSNYFNRFPHQINLLNNKKIYEFPAQVLSIGKIKFPAAGGFYLRALPYIFSKYAIKQSAKKNFSAMVYLHPYDLDPDVPRLKTKFTFRIIRYYNLNKTEVYLKMLLKNFTFSSIKEIIEKSSSNKLIEK